MGVIVGVDPDSDRHGVAIYLDGKLHSLKLMPRHELVAYAKSTGARLAIEDTRANKFIYARNVKTNRAIQNRIAISVGKCQQAQLELERDLTIASVRFEKFPPMRGNWAKNKAEFERVTGWQKSSGEDTRSAAFFGFLLVGARA